MLFLRTTWRGFLGERGSGVQLYYIFFSRMRRKLYYFLSLGCDVFDDFVLKRNVSSRAILASYIFNKKVLKMQYDAFIFMTSDVSSSYILYYYNV